MPGENWRDIRSTLAHHGRVLWLDLVHHPRLAWLAVRIFVHAQVFFGQLVDVGIGALLGDFDYAAADFKIAVRIVRIYDRQGDAGIAADVAILLAAFSGIENNVVTI